jgi:protein-S-isoprenylcysteine O-methyltransferase Ste14
MTSQTRRLSVYYAAAQSALLCAFAGVFVLDSGPDLLVRGTPATIGVVLCAVGLLLMLLAFVSIGRTIQIAPVPRPGRQLVTNGV